MLNVPYTVCFKLETKRDIGSMISYSTVTIMLFNFARVIQRE